MDDPVNALYRNARTGVRASFGADLGRALSYYAPLVEFVSGIKPAENARLLDVGCGVGWSTFAFAEAGYEATGIDLNAAAFEPPPHPRCHLREGSATDIPFPSDSFDVVVSYQCLEHVSAPARALDEMARACRPGGTVAIVGPNLVSPLPGIAYAIKPSSWKGFPARRRPGMARHPYGNTPIEILEIAILRGFQMASKLVSRGPRFSMRQPDYVPPFHADNDACYLCNPIDLISYFRGRGFAIQRRGKPGRPPFSYLLAGGTWVAARKPSASSGALLGT